MPDQDLNQQTKSNQDKLASFENRWKFAVFPAMIAFIMLSAFGFYLIYGMLERMKALSEDIDHMTRVMSETLPIMQGGVVGMSSNMQWVGDDLNKMSKDVHELTAVIAKTMPSMEKYLVDMATNINQMSYSTAAMAATTENMGRNIWDMNRSISKPMSFFGDMMPWQSSNVSTPPPNYRSYQYPNYQYPANRVQQPRPITRLKVTAKTPKLITVIPGKSKYDGFCASCHGVNAEGGVGPDLRSFSIAEISNSLNDYKSGKIEGTMTGVVKILSPDDINNIAQFITDKQVQAKN